MNISREPANSHTIKPDHALLERLRLELKGAHPDNTVANILYRASLPSLEKCLPSGAIQLAENLKPISAGKYFMQTAPGVLLQILAAGHLNGQTNFTLPELEERSGYAAAVISQHMSRLKNWVLNSKPDQDKFVIENVSRGEWLFRRAEQ